MPAGRPRKPTAQLKLSGTYREDRHGKNVDVQLENFLSVPVELLPPKTITDSYCQEHYKYHTNLLIKLKILTASDLPELEMLYLTLQQYRSVQQTLATVDMIADDKVYISLTKTALRLSNYFSRIAWKYYISPEARMRIQIEQLNLTKAKHESPTAKLLKNKRA